MKRFPLEIIALFMAGTALAQPPEVALLTDLVGRVEVQPEGAAWGAATLDAGLLLGDSVRTWDQSNAEIRFVDGTMLMLSERTRVRITTALFNPAEAPAPIRVALAAGALDVRAARAPLEVRVEGGAHHRVEPGEAAHIELTGTRLDVGPPRMLMSTDFAPPGEPPAPERGPAADPAVERDTAPEAAPTPTTPVEALPEEPLPPIEEPMIEPEAETPARTRVRVKVKVRTEVP